MERNIQMPLSVNGHGMVTGALQFQAGCAFGANIQHLAFMRTEYALHLFDEARQFSHGDEIQRRAGKSASMNAPCALSLQALLRQAQRQGERLIVRAGIHILQIHEAGTSAGNNGIKEGWQIVPVQLLRFLHHALFLLEKMDFAHN